MPDQFLKLMIEHGIAVTIVIFVGWMIYKYLNIRLEMMRREFDKKLAEKVYKIEGTINHRILAASNRFEIDLKITEEIAKSQSN